MTDPQTSNIGIYQPTRGSDSGTWDLPVNANSGAIDNLFANVAIISLTNANVTLTTPPTSGSAWSGPYQSQSGILRFTGTLTGNCTITIPRAGFFIVENLCTVGSFYVRLASSSPGNMIGAPPGEATQIYCDGTDVKYVNLGRVGSPLDLHGATAVPAWITACTVLPYLVKDGSTFLIATYPALAALLGTTFGGNGISTSAVPDERARARIAFDTGSTGRLTTAVSGVNGTTMGSVGGVQNTQQHNHTLTDPGHSHSTVFSQFGASSGGQPVLLGSGGAASVGSQTATTGISLADFGTGGSQNVQPSIVSFLPLIKT